MLGMRNRHITMAGLHVSLSQGSHVLQTFEPTVVCSSLRLVSVDSAAVVLLTYIYKPKTTPTLSGRDKSCVRAHYDLTWHIMVEMSCHD